MMCVKELELGISVERRDQIVKYAIIPLIILLFAYALRRYFFCGFILGDDGVEFAFFNDVLSHGPNFGEQLTVRFGGWIFNYISFKIFGMSETAFFLPTWVLSSTLGVIAYFIFVILKYRTTEAFLGGLFVASAPFEILMGTVRSNDLFLSWAMSLSLLFFVLYEQKPIRQGIALAILLWFGFYVKLWVVYMFPALGVYYLFQIFRKRTWSGAVSFSCTSLFLHGITSIFWKIKTGLFLPFITNHAATYPVPAKDLGIFFLAYPKMIFQGSEFGTTFFGIVPYLLLGLLLVKTILSFSRKKYPDYVRLDRFDIYLFVYYTSFFLFLNFFPNNFKFDQYYSVPRIFRYLAPLSFLITLHLAKLILDFSKIPIGRGLRLASNPTWSSVVLIPLILINIYQADNATKPGQIYRKAFLAIIKDVKDLSPPELVTYVLTASWLKELYLKGENSKRPFIPILNGVYRAKDNETWLEENQSSLPENTLLITGFGSYVHYGAHYDGFRLALFSRPLDSHWKLVKDYGILSYLPNPEPARLWRLEGKIVAVKSETSIPNIEATSPKKEDLSSIKNVNNLDTLFKTGMDYFGKNDCTKARIYFKKIIQDFPDKADNARYFYIICYFREGAWETTIAEFKRLIEDHPKSQWVSAAHYHMGLSYKELKNIEQARKEFHYVIDHFPEDTNTVKLSEEQLKESGEEPFGIIEKLYKKLFPNK